MAPHLPLIGKGVPLIELLPLGKKNNKKQCQRSNKQRPFVRRVHCFSAAATASRSPIFTMRIDNRTLKTDLPSPPGIYARFPQFVFEVIQSLPQLIQFLLLGVDFRSLVVDL